MPETLCAFGVGSLGRILCEVYDAPHFRAALEATGKEAWTVTHTSCLGLCDRAPAALVDEQPCGPLSPERVPDIWAGWRGAAPTYRQPLPGEVRVLLAHVGAINPHALDSAAAECGRAAEMSWASLPEEPRS